jgi:hypothetical protein
VAWDPIGQNFGRQALASAKSVEISLRLGRENSPAVREPPHPGLQLVHLMREILHLLLVELVGGSSIEETAEVMGMSPATVKWHWTTARVWLHRVMRIFFCRRQRGYMAETIDLGAEEARGCHTHSG